MARITKCDRCGRVRPGEYRRVNVRISEVNDPPDTPVKEIDLEDCCEVCLRTITKCVTLKKKPRKAKPKGNTKSRARKSRGKADTQAELPTPNGAPAKPAVPPPPEG